MEGRDEAFTFWVAGKRRRWGLGRRNWCPWTWRSSGGPRGSCCWCRLCRRCLAWLPLLRLSSASDLLSPGPSAESDLKTDRHQPVSPKIKFIFSVLCVTKYFVNQADLVQSPAVSWRLPAQRTGPVWSWSLRSGCSPGAGSCPAWLTALTSAPLCLFHSPCIYEAPKQTRERRYSQGWVCDRMLWHSFVFCNWLGEQCECCLTFFILPTNAEQLP